MAVDARRRRGLNIPHHRWVFVVALVLATGLSFVQVAFNFNLVNGQRSDFDCWAVTLPLPPQVSLNGTTVSSQITSPGPSGSVEHLSPDKHQEAEGKFADSASLSPLSLTFKHNITVHRQRLLLSVPFYVYEDLVWQDARWGGKPLQDFMNDTNSNPKHMDDYWFMQSALRHPMRTWNASQAKLFVIPSLHNFLDERAVQKDKSLCYKGICNKKLMLAAAETVMALPFFQNHSKAHLAVVSHFAHHRPWWIYHVPTLYQEMLNRSSNIHFEDYKTNLVDRWSAPKLHVGKPCPLVSNKTMDVVMIATLKPNDERFRDRETICSWLEKYRKNGTTTGLFQMEQCGWGTMCPALARAKLGFHVRGDTPGSNRLLDTLLSGTVPIFTLQKQYQVLPDWIDWERISYFLDMERLDETGFVRELAAILEDTETLQRKLELVLANRHLFDWTGLYPFDTYMYMLQTELYPETRQNTGTVFKGLTSSSILRIPPPATMSDRVE